MLIIYCFGQVFDWGNLGYLWEPSLLAKNDDAGCLTDRADCIAGKRAPTGTVIVYGNCIL